MFDYKQDPTLRALEGLLNADTDWSPAEEGLKDIGAKFKGFVSGLKARATKNMLTKEEKAAIGNLKPQEAAQKYMATVTNMGSDTVVKQFIEWGKSEEAKHLGTTVKGFTYDGKTCALASVPTIKTSAKDPVAVSSVSNTTTASGITINLIYPGKEGAAPSMRTISVYRAALKVAGKDKWIANKVAAAAAKAAKSAPVDNTAAASEALMNATTAEDFLSAMEALTTAVDEQISYAMESFTKDALDSALDAFGKMVDEKCSTVTECEAMASAIAGSSEKYNALLGAMKEGIEKAQTGMIDKETLSKVLATAGAELKSLCDDCGLGGISADDELSDDDITNLRALLLGAKQIVDQRAVALGGGSDQPTGPDGDPEEAAQEALFDGLISFGGPAQEGLKEWRAKHKEKKAAKKAAKNGTPATEGDDDGMDDLGFDDDDVVADEGFKEWNEKRKAKKAEKKAKKDGESCDDGCEDEPAEEGVFTFSFDDNEASMESMFDMTLGDIAMEADGDEGSADTTVAAVKKSFIARLKERRAQKKQIKSEVKNLDMMTLVKEYLTKKTEEGLVLGTGSLLRALKGSLEEEYRNETSGSEEFTFSIKEYRFNGKMVLIINSKTGGTSFDELAYEVVTKGGYKAAVRFVFKEGLAKSVSKDRIKTSKATESIEGLYAFLEDAQIATEANVCCADGNEATILAQRKIAEMNFEIDDDGYTILINTPDED